MGHVPTNVPDLVRESRQQKKKDARHEGRLGVPACGCCGGHDLLTYWMLAVFGQATPIKAHKCSGLEMLGNARSVHAAERDG